MDFDENQLITIGVLDDGRFFISMERAAIREYCAFEPEPSVFQFEDISSYALPFNGRAAAVEAIVEATVTKEPIEEVEEIEAVEAVSTEESSFTEEEELRLTEWRNAYNRWALERSGSVSDNPNTWFTRYAMEKLRRGDTTDELDNQLLSKV